MSGFLKRFFGKGKFDLDENIKRLKDGKTPIFTFPSDLSEPMLDYMLERSYLEDISSRGRFSINGCEEISTIQWLRIDRLPVSPYRIESYDLLSRWQGVLASLHAWNQKTILLLQRRFGQTYLYLGVKEQSPNCINRCNTALINSMPGVGVHILKDKSDMGEMVTMSNLLETSSCGAAITGIPSFRKDTQFGLFQTLDKVAGGFKNQNGTDANYSLIIVAEPMPDASITDVINKFQQLGSEIHSNVMVRVSQNETVSHGEGSATNIGGSIHAGTGQGTIGMVTGLVKSAIACANPMDMVIQAAQTLSGGDMAKAALQALGVSGGVSFGRSLSKTDSASYGESLSKEYLNKFAQYTESVTDSHCQRLRAGRNLGFWNVGVYVLGNSTDDVNLVAGILRSVYSGDKTHIEPIRIHTLNAPTAIKSIRNFNLIPLINPDVEDMKEVGDEWHFLGKTYQYISTPVNTEELSLFTSLPRYDVPGIRFVKNAANFANNSGTIANSDNVVSLGHIVNMGVEQSNDYKINIDALVKHSLIVGSTGCGKTTTCKSIINAVIGRDKPVLIIEPAKDEWVRWAIERNKTLPDNQKITIYEPGIAMLDNVKLGNLMLNPFQPAAIEGAPVDMQTRCENVTSIINTSLPTGDVLPIILDEAIYTYLKDRIVDFEEDDMEQLKSYPLLEGVVPIAKKVLNGRGYDPKVRDGLVAALDTRFNYLTRGKRGRVLNNQISTDYSKLFNRNCVINLSKIASAKDKALIMSILLLSLLEYRTSSYTYDANYREHAMNNELMHLTVIEEAHNVLSRPPLSMEGSGNPQQVVADMFSNMLSEVRSMGEGLMIIDQVPTRLIPDAIKNTNYKICHRIVAADDSAAMAEALSLRDDQRGILPKLEAGNAIIMGELDDAASWVKIKK